MSGAERPEFVSIEDYLSMEEQSLTKSEYVDGWVRAMSGATLRHNKVKGNIMIELGRLLKTSRCDPFDSDTKLRIRQFGRTRFYYPDLQVVCQSNESTAVFQDQPVLIIEVLSPSTRRHDLDEKMAAYLTIPSLECYIVLEQHQPIAIVLRRTKGGFLRETMEGITSTIDLPFLGCTLSMAEIYRGIEFTEQCVQEHDPEYELSEGPGI